MAKQITNKSSKAKNKSGVVKSEFVDLVYTIRNKRIMLDRDLARMYETETRIINQQVKRNIERFDDGCFFRLSRKEFESLKEILKSQNVISSWGGTRYPPYAFTEKGIFMLATVLRSKAAHTVAKHIVNTFIETQKLLNENISLKKRIENLEKEASKKDKVIQTLYVIAIELKKDS